VSPSSLGHNAVSHSHTYYWPPHGLLSLRSLFLYLDPPTLSPSFGLAQAIFEPSLFPYKYPNNTIQVILPVYITYENGTECPETSAHKIQTPGNHPRDRIQQCLLVNSIPPLDINVCTQKCAPEASPYELCGLLWTEISQS